MKQPKYWVAVEGYNRREDRYKWKRRLFYDYNNALIYLARLRFRDESGRRIPKAAIQTNMFDSERADFPII